MLALSKPKNKRAVEMAAHSIKICINGLKLLWFGNAKVNTADLSDILFDSYVQGFLYAIAEINVKLFSHGTFSMKDKQKALSSAYARGFGVEDYDVVEWVEDINAKLSSSIDIEFKRGAINGIIMTNFIQNPYTNHHDPAVQKLLEKARSMADPKGWLITQLWFEELERLKPEFMRRHRAAGNRTDNGSASSDFWYDAYVGAA